MPPNSQPLNVRGKNIRKVIKVILEIVILIFLAFLLIQMVFITKQYQPLSSDQLTNTDGFIALSYFGVDRSGSTKYIARDELEKQLKTLKAQGFETISQEQIIDFYERGKPLPEKALFLSFEDGRNDSSIFSQKILEELNYKATMFTYADKMNTKDMKFLKPKNLIDMMNSGYWELGSNGYRLTYINVFNDQGAYLGEIPENEVPDKTQIEYYNHYLMDYLRDEFMIPKESRREMEERIKTYYELMKDVYTKYFPEMPKAYAIMHANSLYHNMHESVEAVNDKKIKETFLLHFNQDQKAYNDQHADRFNLNRLQVSPRWPVNHLLMKIQESSNWSMDFVVGHEELAQQWSIINGVGEFDQERMILTSVPSQVVKATYLTALPNQFTVTMKLKGAVMGRQIIELKHHDTNNSIRVMLEKNKLMVYEFQDEKDHLMIEKPLDDLRWNGEDYAFNKATKYQFIDIQRGSRIDKEEYPRHLMNNRYLNMTVNHDHVFIQIDHLEAIKVPLTSPSDTYQLVLGGEAIISHTSHEQGVDMIYDSIFTDIKIFNESEIFYTTDESKRNAIFRKLSEKGSDVIDFFIETF